jgi:hypothetical protein
VPPSSSMKHSFSPARSLVAEGHLPADRYSAFLQHSSRVADGTNRGNNKVGSAVYRDERSKPFENRAQAAKFEEKSTMGKSVKSKWSQGFRRAAIAIVATGIAAAPSVHAKPNSKNTAGNPANVVAHIELSGGPATRMLLIKKNGKEYLLLGLDSSSHVAILDVSKPSQPRTMDTVAGAAGAPVTELKVVADTLTLFGTSDAESAVSAGPKEIRSLSGVTAYLKDKAHGLIYVTNGDGLWILKTKEQADNEAQFYGSAE